MSTFIRVRDTIAERTVRHVFPKRRMIPEEVLVELLQARYVEEGIEGRPEVSVVTRVGVQCGVKHVVGHLREW